MAKSGCLTHFFFLKNIWEMKKMNENRIAAADLERMFHLHTNDSLNEEDLSYNYKRGADSLSITNCLHATFNAYK